VERVPSYYEFFAGGGMVRAGLGFRWKCLYANDIDPEKVRTYSANWGEASVSESDIHHVSAGDLPHRADLAWASFPCQDLSCAGNGLGIGQAKGALKTRSGTFWPFIGLMNDLKAQSRSPKIVVLENVVGLLTTNGGTEFKTVVAALDKLKYRLGAAVVDAKHFVPQSRPRVFIIAVSKRLRLPPRVEAVEPDGVWHPEILTKAVKKLPKNIQEKWVWFDLGAPLDSRRSLERVVTENPVGVPWHSAAETRRLISMMAEVHRSKLVEAKKTGKRIVGTLSLRMRPKGNSTVQRAEISFDGLAGCLRTPKGGGSRPRVIVVKGADVRSRLLSPKEAAALMGLGTQYKLPKQYSAAFKVIGDGVAVPAVSFIRDRLLNRILKLAKKPRVRLKKARRPTSALPRSFQPQKSDRTAVRVESL
jgi:DNA (cytosine-5)-methyltransferase 1